MPRFVLVDHSIRDFGGHHWEYAIHVLRAAASAGYEPVLATNREFTNARNNATGWCVYPVYRYDFWGVSARLRLGFNLTRWLKRACGYLRVRAILSLVFSPLGVLWLMRGRFKDLADSELLNERSLLARMVFLGLFSWVEFSLRTSLRVVDAFGNALRTGLIGKIFVACWELATALAYPIFAVKEHWNWGLNVFLTRKRVLAFEQDTRRLFQAFPLGEGDVVFLPTLSEIDMLGLGRYLSSDTRTTRATWHLLFRRNIYSGRETDYPQQDPGLRPLRNAFNAFKRRLKGQKVFFYTDTEPLTAQYNRLGVFGFATLPIPVNPSLQLRSADTSLGKEVAPLNVSYTGDARSEKGYQHIPRLVQDLWDEYVSPGRVRFVLQSNFAFNSPERQAAVVMARSQLERYPHDKVVLICDPLSTEAYKHLVLSSDIGLLLYDRDRYYARSSGALVEFLSAGIPVIVPAGSWLADQIAEETCRYHLSVAETIDTLRVSQGARKRWWARSNRGKINPLSAGELVIGGESSPAFCWFTVPPGATHVLVLFRFTPLSEAASPRSYVNVHIEQLNAFRHSLGCHTFIVRPVRPGGVCTALAPVYADAKRVWLGLRHAFGAEPLIIKDTEVRFLREKRSSGTACPLGSVGLAYGRVEEVPELLRDMIEHYAHYRQTAQQFSKRWSALHNADGLVARLIERGAMREEAEGGVA